MPVLKKITAVLGICMAFWTISGMPALSFPLRQASNPKLTLLHHVHGGHCGLRYSTSRGWHRHREACRDRENRASGWGWCWHDAYGNQLCLGDIRRRDSSECRSSPYALGCRTERWDNR